MEKITKSSLVTSTLKEFPDKPMNILSNNCEEIIKELTEDLVIDLRRIIES